MQIFSAPHGLDRASLIKESQTSHQYVTIAEKKVTWFLAEDEWAVKYQVVVTKTYREEILSKAHETPLAGHVAVNKTCQKMLDHFY